MEDPGYRIESEEFRMWDADYETQGVGSVLQWGQEEGQGDHGGVIRHLLKREGGDRGKLDPGGGWDLALPQAGGVWCYNIHK